MFEKITLIKNVILVALLWSYVACASPLLFRQGVSPALHTRKTALHLPWPLMVAPAAPTGGCPNG